MKKSFKIGNRVRKKGDDNNCEGKVEKIEGDKAYCEFTVVETIDENQANGILDPNTYKPIPVFKNFHSPIHKWVALDELEHIKEDDD